MAKVLAACYLLGRYAVADFFSGFLLCFRVMLRQTEFRQYRMDLGIVFSFSAEHVHHFAFRML